MPTAPADIQRRRVPGLTRLSTVAIIAILAALSAFAFRWVRDQQQIAKRSQLGGRFGQLRLALQNYHTVHGHFPSFGDQDDPTSHARSWRVELLPVMELNDLYQAYAPDEAWNGAANRRLAESLPGAPGFFRSPFSATQTSPASDFLAVDEREAAQLRSEGVQVLTVTIDGADFHIAEVPNSQVHWMDPNDRLPAQ